MKKILLAKTKEEEYISPTTSTQRQESEVLEKLTRKGLKGNYQGNSTKVLVESVYERVVKQLAFLTYTTRTKNTERVFSEVLE